MGAGYMFYSYEDLFNVTTKDGLVEGIQSVAFE